jgi:hypothetical protein
VYVEAGERLRFRRVKAPERAELEALVQSLSERVGRHLERQGLLERDAENGYLALERQGEEALAAVLGSSITFRIALGPHQGRKAFTLRTLAPDRWAEEPSARVAQAAGFSLHAGVLAEAEAEAGERDKLERLCRYIARPAVATQRLSLTAQGQVRYQLKTPYRDGTTHVLFEPVDCMAHIPVRHPSGDLRSCKSAFLPICHRPAGGAGAQAPGEPHPLPWRLTPGTLPSALRASLRLFKIAPGDFFAPNSHAREQVTPARRGRPASAHRAEEPRTEAERRGAMTGRRSACDGSSTSTSRPAAPVAGRSG